VERHNRLRIGALQRRTADPILVIGLIGRDGAKISRQPLPLAFEPRKLLQQGVKVRAPEPGFRGTFVEGAKMDDKLLGAQLEPGDPVIQIEHGTHQPLALLQAKPPAFLTVPRPRAKHLAAARRQTMAGGL
jgi:hypothetical protein